MIQRLVVVRLVTTYDDGNNNRNDEMIWKYYCLN